MLWWVEWWKRLILQVSKPVLWQLSYTQGEWNVMVQMRSLESFINKTELCQIPPCNWKFSSALVGVSQHSQCKHSLTLSCEPHCAMKLIIRQPNYHETGTVSLVHLISLILLLSLCSLFDVCKKVSVSLFDQFLVHYNETNFMMSIYYILYTGDFL